MSAIIPTRLAVRVLFALLVVWSCLQLGCAKSSSNEGGDSSSDTSADTGTSDTDEERT